MPLSNILRVSRHITHVGNSDFNTNAKIDKLFTVAAFKLNQGVTTRKTITLTKVRIHRARFHVRDLPEHRCHIQVRGYCAFLPLLVLWGNKQTVNDKEHIEYIQHILLNTPNRSSVYRYISIDTPCLHTQGTNYRNSLSRRNSLTSSMTKNSEHNANRKLSSNQTSQQQRKE
ncbi:conserved hypothetical protein [Trichinella spiralis]|uniref:hypothetical protein n=1 Tax=Trichinella spiralis TaxID=6334 RepID=UPI0001EFE15F|nr:conserved hypothetical protein [Trichinella spiralis]